MGRRSWLNKILGSCGYELIRRKKSRFGYDILQDYSRLLEDSPKPCIFDVGANIGQSAIEFHRILPKAIIHSFEPSPQCYQSLQKNLEALGSPASFVPNNLGLASAKGQLEFQENEKSELSSFLTPTENIWGGHKAATQVEVSTLADYCAEKGVEQVDLLKCDTQGYELEVLRGGEDLLSSGKIRYIYLEVNFEQLYEGQAQLPELWSYLSKCNFQFVSFYKTYYQANSLAGWTNALFTHKDCWPKSLGR